MKEFLERYDISVPYGIGGVPLILVGVVTAGTAPAGEYHPTAYDSQVLTRRYRVKVKVENVLQGKLSQSEIEILYFVAAENRGSSGTHLSFSTGEREMFFNKNMVNGVPLTTTSRMNALSRSSPEVIRTSKVLAYYAGHY